jgi:hypothetical protein
MHIRSGEMCSSTPCTKDMSEFFVASMILVGLLLHCVMTSYMVFNLYREVEMSFVAISDVRSGEEYQLIVDISKELVGSIFFGKEIIRNWTLRTFRKGWHRCRKRL